MAVLNAPGSWHDSRVAWPIFEALQHKVPDGFFLVADMAFPCGTESINRKIRASLKGGVRITADPVEQELVLKELLESILRLSNLRACCVGINQIHEVYMPTWKASEDDVLWNDLGDMMFGEI
ncbi:hypothetical protein DXG01_011200 [Tephrocybe rancida]|nr:hypothetical protein DXG01_011200 [Tephrocybe rancida]